MATVRFVKPEHVDILRDYLGSDDGGAVVLVYPEMQPTVEALNAEDGDESDYDFGGESDLMVDVVSSEQSYFISHLREEAGLGDE